MRIKLTFEKYEAIMSSKEQTSHFYFRNFKMSLYKPESGDVKVKIPDECGKDMDAIEIFKSCWFI